MTPLGKTHLAPVSAILGTSFHEFNSPYGIEGLAWDQVERVDILAVLARKPGTGQFRSFIKACQEHWTEINVLEDWNPMVGEALARYGFKRFERSEWDGEKVKGWQWKKDRILSEK